MKLKQIIKKNHTHTHTVAIFKVAADVYAGDYTDWGLTISASAKTRVGLEPGTAGLRSLGHAASHRY